MKKTRLGKAFLTVLLLAAPVFHSVQAEESASDAAAAYEALQDTLAVSGLDAKRQRLAKAEIIIGRMKRNGGTDSELESAAWALNQLVRAMSRVEELNRLRPIVSKQEAVDLALATSEQGGKYSEAKAKATLSLRAYESKLSHAKSSGVNAEESSRQTVIAAEIRAMYSACLSDDEQQTSSARKTRLSLCKCLVSVTAEPLQGMLSPTDFQRWKRDVANEANLVNAGDVGALTRNQMLHDRCNDYAKRQQ